MASATDSRAPSRQPRAEPGPPAPDRSSPSATPTACSPRAESAVAAVAVLLIAGGAVFALVRATTAAGERRSRRRRSPSTTAATAGFTAPAARGTGPLHAPRTPRALRSRTSRSTPPPPTSPTARSRWCRAGSTPASPTDQVIVRARRRT